MSNYIKEIKALGIFALVWLLIIGFVFMLTYLNIQNYFYGVLVSYLAVISLLMIVNNVIKSKILKQCISLILIPTKFFLIIGIIIMPFFVLIIHITFYFLFCLIFPLIIFKITKYLQIKFVQMDSTLTYIGFTLTVFIAVLLNHQLRQLIYIISPTRIKYSKKLKPYQLDKLTDYLLSENNIRFLIYSFYVFMLCIINLKNFEGVAFSKNLSDDKAILQSFVTFIAFDRMLSFLKQLEFKPSDMLRKIVSSIINKFNDLEQTNSERHKP